MVSGRQTRIHDPVPSLDPVASRWASFQALPNAHQQLSVSDSQLVFHLILELNAVEHDMHCIYVERHGKAGALST